VHPGVDDRAELGHFDERGVGNAVRRDVLANAPEALNNFAVVVLQPANPPQNFREV
jgi:hypothetical protein